MPLPQGRALFPVEFHLVLGLHGAERAPLRVGDDVGCGSDQVCPVGELLIEPGDLGRAVRADQCQNANLLVGAWKVGVGADGSELRSGCTDIAQWCARPVTWSISM
jgi:hypothetical protein